MQPVVHASEQQGHRRACACHACLAATVKRTASGLAHKPLKISQFNVISVYYRTSVA